MHHCLIERLMHRWSSDSLQRVQFEKDSEGKAEMQKIQALAKTYGLQALAPKPDIKPHIQEAIAKVCCCCCC